MSDYLTGFESILGESGVPGGDDQYRFHCPLCPDSDYKTNLSVNSYTGLWHCFKCDEGGNARKLAALLNSEYKDWPAPGAVPRQKREAPALYLGRRAAVYTDLIKRCQLTDQHREEMTARGIDAVRAGYVSAHTGLLGELLAQWGGETCMRAGVAYKRDDGKYYARRCIAPGRMLIPYYEITRVLSVVKPTATSAGGRHVDWRVIHFVGYASHRDRSDTSPKVIGPAGYAPPLYRLETIQPDCPYLVITEGQLKAEAAYQHGFSCIGMSGISIGHNDVVKACVALRVPRAIILFDTQREGQDNVDHKAMCLAQALLKVGVKAFRAKLPLEAGEEKADIDSYLGKHTAREFAELLADAGRTPYQLEVEEEEAEEEAEEAEEVCEAAA